MALADNITAIYNTKWSYINTFKVHFHFTDFIASESGWGSTYHDLSLYVKNVNTPEYTNAPIEAYLADQWQIHSGRNELWTFTITFRDYNNLSLYKKFVKTYNNQKIQYFDYIKTGVKIIKEGDYFDEKDTTLLDMPSCLIAAVGSISFSNETEAQIAEFDVQFKTVNPAI